MKIKMKFPKGINLKFVFLENDFPVFFSCAEGDGIDYLGCFAKKEKDETTFLISEVTASTIFKVLVNELYLYDAFKTSKDNYLIHLKKNNCMTFEYKEDISDDYLPVKGEYLDSEPEEYLLERTYYLNKSMKDNLNNIKFLNAKLK